MKKTTQCTLLSSDLGQRGFSLLEGIVAIGIMGIVTWASVGMILSLMKENKALSEKLESIELEQSVNRLTVESNVCSCMFDSPAWSAGVSEIELPHLKKGCAVGYLLKVGDFLSSSSTLKTESIKIKNISSLGAGNLMGDLEIKLSGGVRSSKPLVISGLSFSSDNPALPTKISSCMGFAGAQQLCTGMGGVWNGRCSLPPNEGSQPLSVAETCVALGGIFKSPKGPCAFDSTAVKSSGSSGGPASGSLVAHCESYQGGSAQGRNWPGYCFDNYSWCNGSGASFPNNCPAGTTLSNYSKKNRGNCPGGSYFVKFDCIAN